MSARKIYFYEDIADNFDELMNAYDVQRRVEVLFDELLTVDLRGKLLLDLGCGTGWFSRRARARGADVVSVDLGSGLLKQVLAKARVRPVAGNALALPFRDASFDVVVSSEMIEHTTDPAQAVREMARVLKPGGPLALTCPNRAWLWLVNLATALKLRPFQGYENFPSFDLLAQMVRANGLTIAHHRGLHAWPFQATALQGLSRRVDLRFGTGPWGRWMINQAILATKAPLSR
jgi:2-polyprenyl-3-methyl-5-hydroxy-6-metoxy-1,4-benzoquinol methylase